MDIFENKGNSKVLDSLLDSRIILLNSEIYDGLYDNVVAQILQWNIEDCSILKKDRIPITILLNSAGGDVFPAQGLIDIIKESETCVRIIGIGKIHSSAFYIYLAGHERYAFKNTVFLKHTGDITLPEDIDPVRAQDIMDFFKKVDDRIDDFIVNNTSITKEQLDSMRPHEWNMYADQAKELGIVQKIIGEDISLKQVLKD